MTDTQKFWQEEGGDAYTHRNRLDYRLRMPFWRDVLAITGARTVFEVGTNSAANLNAIKAVDPLIQTYGCEPNPLARRQATLAGHQVCIERVWHPQQPLSAFHLSFTVGVLIHVPHDELEKTMQGLINISSHFVLCAEYESLNGREEPIDYRGKPGLLWRRPYVALYEAMGLKQRFAMTLNEDGIWDNVRATLFEKP